MTENAEKSLDSMTFEERLEVEKEYLENTSPGVPYVIFKKTEMRDNPGSRGRVMPYEVPLVFLLNGCHGDVETVGRFERRGWPIVDSGNLFDPDKEINKRLNEVAQHIKGREAYIGMTPTKPAGIVQKQKARQAANSQESKDADQR